MSTLKSIIKKLEVPTHNDEVNPDGTAHWLLNRDIIPLPPNRRTWGPWSFVGLWMLTAVNISGWTSASSLLALGLNVWQAMVVVIIGELLVAACVVGNGFVGAMYHIPFPVYNRFVWGIFGSILPLLMRIMLSFVWYACQLWFGGQSVKVVIGAIWPSFYTLPNTLPPSANMELNDFIAFIIFTVISLPLIYIPPEYYRKPFLGASISITITAFTILIWALAKEHGGGPMLTAASQVSGVVAPTGSKLGWAFVYGINTVIGGICAGILNQSDYTRFAVKPTDQIWSQAIIVPVASSLTAFIGIIVTSCAAGFYPDVKELLWAPYALLTQIQFHGGPGARAAVFFGGCAFVLAQFGINVAGNAISGGIDLSGLFPRFLNIRRGAYLTSIVGVAICPWQLLNVPSTFLTVLSSFSVFLGPLTGCMIADFIIVRNWKLKLTDLYKANDESIYFFYRGVNPRVVIAWVMGVWPLMPGFIAAVNPSVTVSEGWTHMYQLAYPAGFVISATLHVTLSKIWPPRGLGEVDAEDYFGTFGPKTEYIPGVGEVYASSDDHLDEKEPVVNSHAAVVA
ncbi:NCS1 nucleoside transporter [Dacryopinax primogenitus]|uniref:NCS1 nucleoside transporter n=1 Tax=Dacryopinax primogenitus (strain DJM 731) TaxID=1858805 RepID=M5FXL7_DACPD|nr:NCS1 nucleoside transporter [Dacryopinax primogenitus]EJU00535.1 NCS1 nucleoside transporter [Dacryopinax primogenitus]